MECTQYDIENAAMTLLLLDSKLASSTAQKMTYHHTSVPRMLLMCCWVSHSA